MANAWFRKGATRWIKGEIVPLTDTMVAILVGTGYTPDLVNHEFISDLGANIIGSQQVLSGKAVADGALDATDVTFAAVGVGVVGKAVVLAKSTGDNATSPILGYFDTITGFPFTGVGGDLIVRWDNGTPKIVRL